VKKNERMRRNLGFFNLFKLVGGLGGAGRVPARKFLVKPIPEPTRSGFDIFNPNSRKKSKIRPDRGGSARVGRIGRFCPPLLITIHHKIKS
jgi:hypothetical protein